MIVVHDNSLVRRENEDICDLEGEENRGIMAYIENIFPLCSYITFCIADNR